MGTALASQGARTELWVREEVGSPGDLQNEAAFQEAEGLSPSAPEKGYPPTGWLGRASSCAALTTNAPGT